MQKKRLGSRFFSETEWKCIFGATREMTKQIRETRRVNETGVRLPESEDFAFSPAPRVDYVNARRFVAVSHVRFHGRDMCQKCSTRRVELIARKHTHAHARDRTQADCSNPTVQA